MIDYINIKPKKIILLEDEPYVVLSSHVKKKNRQKPSNQTKLKNLISGATIEKAFHQSDRVEEADVGDREIKYLYNSRGEWWFCNPKDPKDRFNIHEDILGDSTLFLKENSVIKALTFNDDIIAIELPAKIDVQVVEAPPNVKGNTSSGGSKPVVVETGATVDTPFFIEVGDIIRVNTETGGYAERVEKA